MNKTIAIILAAVAMLCTGCAPRYNWNERSVITTDAERNAIAAHVEKIMAATPRTLAGHDQDWDDAIAEAHRRATTLFVRPSLWEYEYIPASGSGHYTGRWRYIDEITIRGDRLP